MWRQVNNKIRSQRARGLTLKQALQSFLVVVFCVCLLCQVQHSNDKKRELEEKNPIKVISVESWRLGRKDIPCYTWQTDSTNDVVDELEERNSSNVVEEQPMTIRSRRKFLPIVVDQEIKQKTNGEKEEEPQLEDIYHEKGAETGDDDIDEEYQPKSDEEVKQGVESADEDEQDEKDEEKVLVNYQDNEKHSQLAQEENYIRDNITGSVFRDSQTIDFEMDGGEVKSSNEENIEEDIENLPMETVALTAGIELSVRAVGSSDQNISGISLRNNKTMPTENSSSNATIFKNELKSAAKNSVRQSVELAPTPNSKYSHTSLLINNCIGSSRLNSRSDCYAQIEKTTTAAAIKEIEGSNTASSDNIVTEGRKGSAYKAPSTLFERNSLVPKVFEEELLE